jgi:hypothetical protein
MGPVNKSYTANEKLAVIAYAEAHGNSVAQREFGINFRRWRDQKENLQKKTQQVNRGKQSAYSKIEESLLQFLTEWRSQAIDSSTAERQQRS